MIDISKKYKTRDGRAARILVTDLKTPHFCVVAAITHTDGTELAVVYGADGLSKTGAKRPYDLVEHHPAMDFKKDQAIWVRDRPEHRWQARHFAHFEDGRVHSWQDGKTSHTAARHETLAWVFHSDVKPNAQG